MLEPSREYQAWFGEVNFTMAEWQKKRENKTGEPSGALDVQTRDIHQDELLRIWHLRDAGIEEAIYPTDRIPARMEREIRVPVGPTATRGDEN